MMTSSMSPDAMPCRVISWVSQTAYSSAVRFGSFELRQLATSLSCSKTPKTTLVLPESIASSMNWLSVLLRGEKDIAESNLPGIVLAHIEQQRTGGVQALEHAM